MTSLRLSLAHLRHRPLRFALCAMAMAMAVTLVVAITSGYASMEKALRGFVEQFIGATDFEIVDPADRLPSLDPQIARDLLLDPRVARVHARIEARAAPLKDDGSANDEARLNLFGIDPQLDPIASSVNFKEGRWFTEREKNAIVIDENAADIMGISVGDRVRFARGAGDNGPLELTVTGIVRQISFLKGFFRVAYLPLTTAGEFVNPDRPGDLTKIRGEFNVGVDAEVFSFDWSSRIARIDEQIRFKLIRDERSKLDQNLRGMRLVSFLGSAVAMLAATFIVFGTLSMGVTERRRQLGMLRAVGATRGLVTRMVILDALLLGIAGLIIGVPLGLLAVRTLDLIFPDLFSAGLSYDYLGILFACCVTMTAALVASILPAYHASRTSPLEAMSSHAQQPPARLPWRSFVIGLFLLSLDTIIVLFPWSLMTDFHADVRMIAHFLVGYPTLFIGFFLVAPMTVWIVERCVGPMVARIASVRFELLRQQLSGSAWRSAGTGAALMVGLAVLVVMNVQSTSVLSSWQLPEKFPDVFVLADGGRGKFDDNAINAIRKTPGVDPDRVMPIHVASPRLGDSIGNLALAFSLPNATVFVGVDPNNVFDMLQLDWRGGDEATAKRMWLSGRSITLNDGSKLEATIERESHLSLDLWLLDGSKRTVARSDIRTNEPGRYLVITTEFRKLRGDDVGSRFLMEVGMLMRREIEFTVVGVVWSPGMDVLLGQFDLANKVQEQTAATVFGTIANARDDLGSKEAMLIAAMIQPGVEREALIASMRSNLSSQSLGVHDVRAIKETMVSNFRRVVMMAGTIAWGAMLVACLGVSNTIIAGVQSRRWQIGVLRSIGLTRGELTRLILCESALLGVVGVVLGLLAGLLMAFNVTKLYARVIGIDPPINVPWATVLLAMLVVVIMSIVAGLWPARSTARRAPLELLQAGRAAG